MRRRAPWMGVAAAMLVGFLATAPAVSAQDETDAAVVEPSIEPDPDAAAEPAASWETDGGPVPADRSDMPPSARTPLRGDEPDYVLGPADLIQIRVWRNPELSTEVPVRPDGRISVPLLGDVEAAGLTSLELRDRVAEGLSDYIAAPDVTVMVKQVNSKVVFLVGEVARPTALPLTREMRVLDAISIAGGFSPFANKRKIRILRQLPDGSVEQHKFNYNRFVKGKDPEANLQLQSGDTIVVPD